jgi:hypothetical protein
MIAKEIVFTCAVSLLDARIAARSVFGPKSAADVTG